MIRHGSDIVFDDYKEYLKIQYNANHSNNFTGSTNRPWIDYDLNILITYLTNKDSSILSVGSRDFYDLRYLKNNGYTNLYACDIDSRCSELAKKFGINFATCDIHEYTNFGLKFDSIYCRHVLEHCYDVNIAISNIFNYLKNDSYVMLVVPLEKDLNLIKKRGHCHNWETLVKFENFCNKYFKEILCIEDTVSRKKPQCMYLGKKE
jgi:SAM-dependent methyltransferase